MKTETTPPRNPPANPDCTTRRLPLALRRHPLIGVLRRDLVRRCRVSPGTAIVVGVSGGADSLALLLGLLVLHDREDDPLRRSTPVVAHVHHHLRDDSADAEAEFVRELCRHLDVAYHLEHVEPAAHPGNTANNARELRYAALARVAAMAGAAHIAVAHHAEDQFETMLIALCRGTGVDGLSGMPWSRPLSSGMNLIRPILGFTKEDCRELCRAAGIDWMEDPSNADPSNLRARLRRDVIPVLEELWPDAARRATSAADAVEGARQALEGRIEAGFGPLTQLHWSRKSLRTLPLAVIAGGLRRAAVHAAPAERDGFGQRQVIPAAEAILDSDSKPKQFHWPGGLTLEVNARTVRLVMAGVDSSESGRHER